MTRGGRLVAAVALALLFAAVAIRRWSEETLPSAVAPRPAPSAGEPAARWSAAPEASAAVPSALAVASAVSGAEPALDRPAVVVWDLCGVGRMPVPRGADALARWPDLPPHLGKDAVDAGREQLLAALRRGDTRARAAALYWAPVPSDATLAQPDDDGATELLDEGPRDPVVLRWAAARCRSETCRAKAAARWSQLDPQNAVPRLIRMSTASRVPEEAFLALRATQTYRSYWGAFAETARRAMPADLPGYVQMSLLVEALGIDAAMPDNTFMLVTAWCKPPYAPGRQQERHCDALGRVMSEHGDTILAFGIGLRLREMAGGLDAAEVRALREPLQKLPWDQVVGFDLAQPLSCGSLAGMQRWVEAVGRDGELPAVRAAIAAATPYSSSPPQSR